MLFMMSLLYKLRVFPCVRLNVFLLCSYIRNPSPSVRRETYFGFRDENKYFYLSLSCFETRSRLSFFKMSNCPPRPWPPCPWVGEVAWLRGEDLKQIKIKCSFFYKKFESKSYILRRDESSFHAISSFEDENSCESLPPGLAFFPPWDLTTWPSEVSIGAACGEDLIISTYKPYVFGIVEQMIKGNLKYRISYNFCWVVFVFVSPL